MTENAALRARFTVQAGRVCLDQLQDGKKAMAYFEEAIRKYQTAASGAAGYLRIGVGDCWRASGDYDRAAEAYAAAKPLSSAEKDPDHARGLRPARRAVPAGQGIRLRMGLPAAVGGRLPRRPAGWLLERG